MRRTALSTLLVLAAVSGHAQQTAGARQDVEALERALDGAVRQVSRASVAHPLGVGEACRSYVLKGYGVVFVLSPRVLPSRGTIPLPVREFEADEAALSAGIRAMEEGLKHVSSPEIRAQMQRRMEALRRMQQAPRPSTRGARIERPQDKEIRALEEQALVMEREADEARQDAERALEDVRREVQSRLIPPPAAPAPSSARDAGPEPDEAPPPPPWHFWFDRDEEPAGRAPEAVIQDVRAAVTNVLETHGGRVRAVPPEEFVVVAVDFVPRGRFGAWGRPERTLVIRVRKKELEDRLGGRLASAELRKKIEYVEY